MSASRAAGTNGVAAPATARPAPSQEAWPARTRGADRLSSYARKLASQLVRAANRMASGSDPEAIHDLRVTVRRWMALSRVWREAFRPRARRKARQALGKLRRKLGQTRELEVHVTLLERHLADPSDARTVPALAARTLRARLARRRAQCAQWARGREVEGALERVRRASSRIAVAPGETPPPSRARERVAKRARAARRALTAALEDAQPTRLHRARIEIKKLRYEREALAAGSSPRPTTAAMVAGATKLERLKQLQDLLGTILDNAALRRELAGVDLTPESLEDVLPVIRALDEERRSITERFLSTARKSPALV